MAVYLKGRVLEDVFTGNVLHCRTCFTISSKVYNPLSPTMINCLLECVSLQLHDIELNNAMVCQSCSKIMETFIKFKNKCHEVDALFKKLNLNHTPNNKLDLDQKNTVFNNTIVENILVKSEPVEPKTEFNNGEIYDEEFEITVKDEITSINDSTNDNAINEEYDFEMMTFQDDNISINEDEDNEIENTNKNRTKRKQPNGSYWKRVLPTTTPEIIARIDEPRNCKVCGLACQHGRSLINHITQSHKDLTPTFFCQEPKQLAKCKGGFKCEEALMLHVYARHMTKWKFIHGENHKKKQFYYKKVLPPNTPEIIAKIDEPRNCKVCGIACKNGRFLTKHVNGSHKDLKPIFFCQEPKQLPSCKAGFKCEEALMLHVYSYHMVKWKKIRKEIPVVLSKNYFTEDRAIKKEFVDDDDFENANMKETKQNNKPGGSNWEKVHPQNTPEIIARINEPRNCKVCDFSCENGQSLITHMNCSHKDLNPTFFCQEPNKLSSCKVGFRCEEALMLHVYSWHMIKWKKIQGEKPAIKEEFVDDDGIKNTNHKKTNKNKKPDGPYWEKVLPLNTPEIIARIDEPRNCKVCDSACGNGRSLINHMKNAHKDLKGNFFCQEPKQHSRCKVNFQCEESLMLHVYSRHMTKWRLIKRKNPVVPSKNYFNEDHPIKEELIVDDNGIKNTNYRKTKKNKKPDESYSERVLPLNTPEIIARIDEPRNCKVCDAACENGRSLIRHMKNAHPNQEDKFFCQEPKQQSRCKDGFSCEEALMLHVYTRHMTKWRLIKGKKPVGTPTQQQLVRNGNTIEGQKREDHCYEKIPELVFKIDEVSELISKMNEPRKCQICEIECSNVYLLISHVNSDHTDKELSFVCSKSCESFRCREELTFHKYTHCMMKRTPDEKVPMINIEVDKLKHCPFCGTDSSLIENFLKHFRKCSYQSCKNECPVCKKTIKGSHMKKHMEIHDANRILPVCDLCGKSVRKLQQHIRVSHLNVHDKKFKCVVCGERFETLSNVVQHRKTVHIDVIQSLTYRWECDICGKKYKSHGGLRCHKNLDHKKKMQHKCPDCGKLFKLRSWLEGHKRRVHLKEKNHNCKYCGMGFFYFHEVKEHMTVHTGEKRFECHICQKRFRIRDNLKTHLKSHARNPRKEAW